MNYLIGIWNWFAVMVYVLIIFLAFRLAYIYSKEESGYRCVEMPNDSKSPLFPGELAKAVRMGFVVFSASTFFVLLFEWWIGEPAIGGFVALLAILIYYYPKEIADFWGEVKCLIGDISGSITLAKTVTKCPECWSTKVRPLKNQENPVCRRFFPLANFIPINPDSISIHFFPDAPPNFELLKSKCSGCGKTVSVFYPIGTAAASGLSYSYAEP